MVTGETGAQPDWPLHRTHPQGAGGLAGRHVHQGPRSPLTLEDSETGTRSDWRGWRTGSGTRTVRPPSAASLKLVSPQGGQQVSAEQGGPPGAGCGRVEVSGSQLSRGGPPGAGCGHSTGAEHPPLRAFRPCAAQPLLQLPPPGHSLLAEQMPIHKLQHLYHSVRAVGVLSY